MAEVVLEGLIAWLRRAWLSADCAWPSVARAWAAWALAWATCSLRTDVSICATTCPGETRSPSSTDTDTSLPEAFGPMVVSSEVVTSPVTVTVSCRSFVATGWATTSTVGSLMTWAVSFACFWASRFTHPPVPRRLTAASATMSWGTKRGFKGGLR